jgi:pyruvate formate lyase activating enzyme
MMKIGGLQKVSLIDYPGKISAILFTQGCNFKCPYCHNPELVDPDLFTECQSDEDVFSFLKKRRGKLDAVTITGGEPTLQHDLTTFIKNIKKLGYLIKIDTNGSRPEIVNNLITKKLVDYIAMDVKGPLGKYGTLTRSHVDEDKIRQSIDIIMASGIPYEFRTTVLKSQLDVDDILEIGKLIKNANLYVLQTFVASKTLDPNYIHELTYTEKELEAVGKKLMRDVASVMVR